MCDVAKPWRDVAKPWRRVVLAGCRKERRSSGSRALKHKSSDFGVDSFAGVSPSKVSFRGLLHSKVASMLVSTEVADYEQLVSPSASMPARLSTIVLLLLCRQKMSGRAAAAAAGGGLNQSTSAPSLGVPGTRPPPHFSPPTGLSRQPSSIYVTPSGTSVAPSGTSVTPSGTCVTPSGTCVTPSGTCVTPSGSQLAIIQPFRPAAAAAAVSGADVTAAAYPRQPLASTSRHGYDTQLNARSSAQPIQVENRPQPSASQQPPLVARILG